MASERSTKDKEMAAFMKRHGIERTHGRCPTCYGVFTLKALPNHIGFNCNGPRQKGRKS